AAHADAADQSGRPGRRPARRGLRRRESAGAGAFRKLLSGSSLVPADRKANATVMTCAPALLASSTKTTAMKIRPRSPGLAVPVLRSTVPTTSAETVKVGIIAPFSGPTASFGTAWKQAIDVYQQQHGGSVGRDKVEIVMRDLPGPDPLKAK